jgi:hypothetical protein
MHVFRSVYACLLAILRRVVCISFCFCLVERREKLPPLAGEHFGVLLPLISGELLSSPKLHEEYGSRQVDYGYMISFIKSTHISSLLPISKPVIMTIPKTPRVSYQ